MRKLWLPFLIFLSNFWLSLSAQKYPIKAVIIVPIADLVCKPLQTIYNTNKAIPLYQQLPYSYCRKSDEYSCARIHQSLFNEMVTILEEKGEEARVQITNVFYELKGDQAKHTTYWTLKKNLLPLHKISEQLQSTIPDPITYRSSKKPTQHITTLIVPFTDSKTHISFSAGTRFVVDQTSSNGNNVTVSFIHPKKLSTHKINIPKKVCYRMNNSATKTEKINHFVKLIQLWARQPNGFIPYVWGGCSLTTVYNNDQFSIGTKKRKNTTIEYYTRKNIHQQPKNGFDCAGLIARAAQICNIPYYFKNTTTVEKYLKSLEKKDRICNGDLIWFFGHVMVIADIKQNTIVEARSYEHGFGKVHELSLNKVFQGIQTFDQLIQNYVQKKPLKRLDAQEKVVQTITEFKILRLSSVWQL